MNSIALKQGLRKYPPNPTLNSYRSDPTQAWDSADELILNHLSPLQLEGKKILILNDAFGALSCSLEGYDITSYTDSYLSFKGIQINSENRIHPITQIGSFSGPYDLVLIKIPKNMSFFEDLLCHLSHHLRPDAKIICGYKIKHQAKASFDLLNQYIGETTTSLAQKKARLIFANFQKTAVHSPYPLQIHIENFEKRFLNHSNLFSREKLDMGTRFLLEHLPKGDHPVILDLGCANGVVGIAAKRLNPSAKLIFSDESQMSIQSAMSNYAAFFSDKADFYWTHCFENQPSESVNLVLCNPPFHQGHTLGDSVATQMFLDSHRALVRGGTLQVIGNSHLPYPSLLKRIFGNSQIIATHQKFIIVCATK
jgi:23S rRNA (guanine1835-N2)-methyltransferase